MNISTTKSLLSITVTLLLSSLSVAQSVDYAGGVSSPKVRINFANSTSIIEQCNFLFPSATETVTIDQSAPTISFDSYVFHTEAQSFTFTENVTTGFGASNNYTITLNFDPATFVFNDYSVRSLVPASNATYSIPATTSRPSAWSLNYSGTYTISGPAHSMTGSFATSARAATFNPPTTLDTSSYPDTLTLLTGFTEHSSGSGSVFDVTLDDAHLTWTYGSGLYSGATVSLTSVPEPSVNAAITGIVVLCIASWRRRIVRK